MLVVERDGILESLMTEGLLLVGAVKWTCPTALGSSEAGPFIAEVLDFDTIDDPSVLNSPYDSFLNSHPESVAIVMNAEARNFTSCFSMLKLTFKPASEIPQYGQNGT